MVTVVGAPHNDPRCPWRRVVSTFPAVTDLYQGQMAVGGLLVITFGLRATFERLRGNGNRTCAS